MLYSLNITNFALIDQISFEPSPSFSAITGETGAGKSIILGALGLVLGNRADSSSLLDSSTKCVIEATFKSLSKQVVQFLKTEDFDVEEELLIRREITPSGKSRSFINDTPANLSQLKSLGDQLLQIHSQNSHTELKNHRFLITLVDSVAGIQSKVEDFSNKYLQYKSDLKRLNGLKEAHAQAQLDQDYNEFLFNELNEINLQQGELSESEEELSKLQHAEEIQQNLTQVYAAISEEGGNVLGNLYQAEQLLSSIGKFSSAIELLHKRINEVRIELEDIHSDVNSESDSIEYNPTRLEELADRVNTLNQLMHKHRVGSELELIEIRETLSSKLSSSNNLEQEINVLKEDLTKQLELLEKMSSEISSKRLSVFPSLEKNLTNQAKELGIKEAELSFKLESSDQMNELGNDHISLLFTANKGHALENIAKVASGGELSRIMLAIKHELAKTQKLPAIVFDEIDTGVSGEIANKMGDIMLKMSKKIQVISITHLPQIAAKGESHFSVLKKTVDGKTVSSIQRVQAEERVMELAKMLSGKQISDIAKENARILLNN